MLGLDSTPVRTWDLIGSARVDDSIWLSDISAPSDAVVESLVLCMKMSSTDKCYLLDLAD